MLDFARANRGELTLVDLADGLTPSDLADLTNEMIDRQLVLIADCNDADVVFVPVDPYANDPYAASAEERRIAWTLGHLIVHVTASAEESAFLAAEIARGVLREGRSRYETPWQSVSAIAQCRARLEESRRMRLATLQVWPDTPHFEVTTTIRWIPVPVNAVTRFLTGLHHDHAHLAQIEEVVRQARQARAQ